MAIFGCTCEYSLLGSLLKIDDIIHYAVQNNYPFLAISDLDNIFVVHKFFKKAKAKKIRPIIGVELKVKLTEEIISNFLLYPKNEMGYYSLLKLLKKQNYKKEQLTANDLYKLCNDIIVITSGTNSFVYKNLPKVDAQNYSEKQNYPDVIEYTKIIATLDENLPNFYVGISYDTLNAKNYQTQVIELICQNNKILCLPVHKTCYYSKIDRKDFNCFIKINDLKNELEEDCDYAFWDLERIEREFSDSKKVFNNLKLVLKEIDFDFEMPSVCIPQVCENPTLEIKMKCLERLEELKLGKSDKYLKRLDEELKVIDEMGFSNYFLIVEDFINYGRKNNILIGPGRGSSAASLVTYLLNITLVDPMKHDLYFERFLNKERNQFPDIDIDIPDNKREEMLEYLSKKYGKEHIAFITTFDTFGAKSAIRDITRIKEHIKRKNKSNPDFSNIDVATDSKTTSEKIEGLPRHIGVHPAGIIFSESDISYQFPVRKTANGYYQIDFEMSELEEKNILKTDLLSLKNLKIIADCLLYIKENQNIEIDLKNIALDDKNTFKLLNDKDTDNIFQLESDGIKNVIAKIKPDKFDDIVSILALFRPGPMKNIEDFALRKAGESFEYIDDSIKDILAPTFGFIIFQEQIMQIAQKFANYSFSQADILRRAISKKNEDLMLSEKEKFVKSSIENEKDGKAAEKIYTYIYEFASYGFNKAHAVAYSMITYAMAYLKANYFLEFALAILNNSFGDFVIIKKYLRLLEKKGYTVHPPLINRATKLFYADENNIYIPLLLVKNITKDNIQKIIDERKNGEYKNFKDCKLRLFDIIGEKGLECLIFASAFNDFSKNKKELENMLINQSSLDDLVEMKEEEIKDFYFDDLSNYEKLSLGFNYFYDKFLLLKSIAKKHNIPYFSCVDEVRSGVYCANVIDSQVKKYTKDNREYIYKKVKLSDWQIELDCVCFKEELCQSEGMFIENYFYKVEIVKTIYQGRDSYIITKARQLKMT